MATNSDNFFTITQGPQGPAGPIGPTGSGGGGTGPTGAAGIAGITGATGPSIPALTIVSNSITDPATITVPGRYLVPASGTSGSFVGQENNYASFDGEDFTFTTPSNGDIISVTNGPNSGTVYTFNAGAWTLTSRTTPLQTSNWTLSGSYLQGDLVINNTNVLYQANGNIPANTAFAVGTAGATWRGIEPPNTNVPIYVQAGNNSGQTIPTAAVTTITNWTTSVNTLPSAWNATTGVFTCPRAGWYRLRGSVTYATNTGAAGTEFNTILSVNGGNSYTGWVFKQAAANVITPTTPVEAIHFLNVNDTVVVRTYQITGSPLALIGRVDVNLLTIQELPARAQIS
jgi:hypothetical protein